MGSGKSNVKSNISRITTSLLVVMACLMAGIGFAQDADEIPFLLNPESGYNLTIYENDREAETVIGITVEAVEIGEIVVGDSVFSTVTISDAGTLASPGQPELPLISNTYRISDTHDPMVTIRPLKTRTVYLKAPVLPSQQCDIEDVVEIVVQDTELYRTDEALPIDSLMVGTPEIFRDLRVAQITWCPVTYYPASGRLEIVESAELRISAGEKSDINVLHGSDFPITATWGSLYRAMIPNFDESEISRDGEEHYLVVIQQGSASYLTAWLNWKATEGFDVTVMEIPPGTTTTQLYNLISAEYVANRPTFVMLAGRESEVPVYTSSYSYYWNGRGWSGNYSDDEYYARLEGTDYLPEVLISRLPGNDSIRTMLNRALYWETTPYMAENYYGHALMSCAGYYASQQLTKEQVAERLYRVHNYDYISEHYTWPAGTLQQIMNRIDSGVSILNYRGEGWTTGWSPGFQTDDVDSLNNLNKPLVVTSIGCGVANFTGGYCFGEAWMRLGSATTVKGAVAFCGPTWNSHTSFNNWLDRGMYRGLAYDDLAYVSQAYLAGKMYMRSHYPTYDEINRMYFGLFTMFGTPDTRYRTILPTEPLYGFAYSPTSDDMYLSVRTAENWPAANAKVVVDPQSPNRTVMTLDSSGQAPLLLPQGTESVEVHVAGYNMVPFIATIDLSMGAQGRLLITEVKPDITTDGTQGDMVELYNADDVPIDLKNMILTDFDLYDVPFITESLILEPGEFAVITFVGPRGEESVTSMAYGYAIDSRAFPGFDAHEDQCVLRNAYGQVLDAMAWHNNDGQPATRNDYRDLSRFTYPTSGLDVRPDGWWDAPDNVDEMEYEQYTVNWSAFAGMGGPGSMQRVLYEELDDLFSFEAREETTWGALADPPECRNHGDVNRDYEITSDDAQQTFLIALGSINPSHYQNCAADCNGDGDVTAGDAQSVFLMVLGLGQCVDDIEFPTPTPIATYTPIPVPTSTPVPSGYGENCNNPIIINSIPFSHDGNTAGFTNDYDEQCPYAGSAPDVVYAYQPSVSRNVSLTLCTGITDYDTKLYIYENDCSGPAIACSDDECSAPGYADWVSALENVSFTSGNTYYIVVDGFGSSSGNYTLEMTE